MSTSTNTLFSSSRRAKAFGLLIAGGVLFLIGIGGSGALVVAYTGAVANTPVVAVHGAS
jgi:hypothetical protein